MGLYTSNPVTIPGLSEPNLPVPAANVTGPLANATIPAGNVTGSGGLLSLSLMPKWMQARGRVLAKTGGAKILTIGESTTRGNGSGGATGNMGLSYPTQLAQMLSARGLPAS
jgi:hypothetical protein